jgi:adenylate cyclase
MSEVNTGPGPIEQRSRWPAFLERIVDIAVLPGDRPDLVTLKRLFTAAMWASMITTSISVYQLILYDAPWAAASVSVPIVTAAVSLTAMWISPRTYPGVMHVAALGTVTTTFALIIILGGVFPSAGNTAWGVLAVVGAVAIFADRRAHFWLAVFVLGTIVASTISQRIEPLYQLPNREYFAMFNVLAVAVFIYAILFYFVKRSDRLYRQSEDLLRNVLPDEVAERLKRSQEMIADEFASASILFADVAGFTPMSAQLEPEEVINLLNEIFTSFDSLVVERGLEKIKTIGDAYMVAAGVPVAREDHADAICDLALAMRDHLESHTFAGRHLQMRIGVASGPVMAGIIGRRKFSYDLWGDTVNMASRMESTGTPGLIQLTEVTCLLVEERFECQRRGVVEVKGKGPTETWYLVGRRSG